MSLPLSRRFRTPTRFRRVAVAACAVVLPGLASLPAAYAAVAVAAVKPGLTGSPITLASNAQFSGYDMATGPNGTAYLGWIADTGSGRKVSLCTLPRGATRCAGGIQTIVSAPDSIGTSSAAGLRVLVSKSNLVTLVWMHDTVAAESGPEGDKIAIATAQGGAHLTPETDVSAGPSFGTLLDATLAPNGSIWTVAHPSANLNSVQVTRGLGNTPQTVKTPFWPGHAVIAFSGAGAVLAIDKYGAVTQPVSYARQSGSG